MRDCVHLHAVMNCLTKCFGILLPFCNNQLIICLAGGCFQIICSQYCIYDPYILTVHWQIPVTIKSAYGLYLLNVI